MMKDIGYRRLVDEVAEQLRDKIYAGEYVPGDHLRQEHLAATLEVSRTPLREALRVLERDKLLTVLPGGRIQVANADLPNLLAAYELREVVDGLAASLISWRTSARRSSRCWRTGTRAPGSTPTSPSTALSSKNQPTSTS
jgi:DNA-binding GntR family transcriptional regulator